MQCHNSKREYTYLIEESTVTDENDNDFICYSVLVMQNNNIIERCDNVFFNGVVAQKLADTCNELMLDPVHIYDVIEDAIYDLY